ncbi:MAG: lipid-A-disaccharide synthase [Flavobacteriales bacterium]|nr:lipid-A-disaccharide synthase [Flavobacteriales bacterium]
MRYYIISGESSGDLHGSNLVKGLRKVDTSAQFRAWGGEHLQSVGVEPVKHIRDLAFMGFVEVLANLRTILRNIDFCKKDIESFHPDVLILIDYPGFNMRIARWAKEKGIKVVYYIAPQVWAWKQKRALELGKITDLIITILPFEKDFFARFGISVHYVGHPLLDAMENYSHISSDPNQVAILPGSRKMEIKNMLPVMLETAARFPELNFVIAASPSVEESFYKKYMGNSSVPLVFGKTYSVLAQSKAALVTSGTATLETALLSVPQAVCYRGNAISYLLVKQMIKVKFISLVNLILDRHLVNEFIQHDLNADALSKELTSLLYDKNRIQELNSGYLELHEKLGGKGASDRTAELIFTHFS